MGDLGRKAEALGAIIGSNSLQRRPVDQKFQVERVTPTMYSYSQKTRLNVISYGIKMWIDFTSILSQFTRLTDGQTDRQNSHR